MSDLYHDVAEAQGPRPRIRSTRFFYTAVVLLIIAAFFRLWHLGSAPPGMHAEELVNIQLSEQMARGHVSVLYEEARPAREGLYFALLAGSTALTGHGLILWRLPSVWLSLLSLAMTATLLRRLFGSRVALLATGLMAVTFWPVWIGRMVLHITVLPLATTFSLYVLTRAYLSRETTNSSLWFTVAGISLGVAQYIHATAWTLPVLMMVFVVYRSFVSREEVKHHLGNVLYSLSLVAVMILPLLIFLIRHPGAREPVPLGQQPGLLAEIPGRIVSSLAGLALRGDMLPDHNIPGRPVMGPIIAALLVMGIAIAIARIRRPQYGLAILWLAVGLLPTAFLPRKPDFEYMAIILPVIFVFPALSMAAIYYALRSRFTDRLRPLGLGLVTALVFLIVGGAAVNTYRDYFMIWPTMGDVRLNYEADLGVLARYLDTSDDPSPISVCSTPVDRQSNPFALTNADLLHLLMHRRDVPIRYFDCTQGLVLASGGESQRIIFPRGHYYDHLPGSLLVWMQDAQNEDVPYMRPDVIMRVDVSVKLADTVGAFITTAPTAWPPESGSELAALPVPFEGNVTFLGYEVRDETLRSTDWVEMTTYWRLDGPPPAELSMFAHLLGNPVVVISQDTGLGAQINTLQARDVFLQYSMIQTPGQMAEGLYPLSVGLYIPSRERRVSAYLEGAPRADRLFLQRVHVKP